jgi:outer membrane protein assembly factor BamB
MRLPALLAVLVCALLAQDWIQWRGPARDGTVSILRPLEAWPKSLAKAWSAETGGGYSSPVVSAARAFVISRQGENELVQAIDLATGRVLWKDVYPAPFTKSQYAREMAAGPFSTPLVHSGRLYTLGVTAVLSCYDPASGRRLWRNDYSKRVDTGKLFTGTAMSPIAEAATVIVHIGDDTRGTLTALDAATGAEKWKWEEDGPGYASPIVAEIGGARHLITLTSTRVVALDPASGSLLWSHPFKDQWNENIVTPVAAGNRVFVSGVRAGGFALDIHKQGARWIARQAWHSKEAPMYMSSPVLDAGRLYGFSSRNKGQFFCQDGATDKVLWTSGGRDAQSAALISSGNALIALTPEGELVAIRRTPEKYEELGRYRVAHQGTWAHPVPVNGGLLVKDQASLTLWKLSQ